MFFLFISMRLKNWFIKVIWLKLALCFHDIGTIIRKVWTIKLTRRPNIVTNPLPIWNTSTILHCNCHTRCSIFLLDTHTTCQWVIYKVMPLTQELILNIFVNKNKVISSRINKKNILKYPDEIIYLKNIFSNDNFIL